MLESFFIVVSFWKHILWQETSDPTKIAMDRFGMELNSFYKKKGEDEVWTLVKVDKNHAHFEHSPLFQAPGSGPQGLKVLHADLKDWKKAIGKPPRLLTAQELQSLLPENNIALDLEATKAQAQTALVAHYKQEATGDGIAFAAGVHGAFANQTFAKGKLKPFPVGTLSFVKGEAVKASMCIMQGPTSQFQIMAPKVDLEKCKGIAVPYFHVGHTLEPTEVNMEKASFKLQGYTIPYWRNTQKVDQGALLLGQAPVSEKKGKKPRLAWAMPPGALAVLRKQTPKEKAGSKHHLPQALHLQLLVCWQAVLVRRIAHSAFQEAWALSMQPLAAHVLLQAQETAWLKCSKVLKLLGMMENPSPCQQSWWFSMKIGIFWKWGPATTSYCSSCVATQRKTAAYPSLNCWSNSRRRGMPQWRQFWKGREKTHQVKKPWAWRAKLPTKTPRRCRMTWL